VRSLVLIEPALVAGESAEAYRSSLASATERVRHGSPEVLVDAFLRARWPEYREHLDDVVPGALERAVADAGAAFAGDLPALLAWEFTPQLARRIEQPVCCVLGGASATLSPRFEETQRLLLDWLPHAEAAVVPGATHLMQLEQPAATAEAIASFLDRQPAARGGP
jgi:3-oxoadipate enol-lactonase/4-carboxymuconolactone decarboxylase